MKEEGDNIRLAHNRPWDSMPRLEGWGASDSAQPVVLRLSGYTGAHLKSYGDEQGALEVIRANREIPQRN